MQMNIAPLDSLVIAQLSALRQHEAALEEQFHAPSANREAVAVQLQQLQQRADRLSRMIDAMGVSNPAWFAAQTAPIVA